MIPKKRFSSKLKAIFGLIELNRPFDGVIIGSAVVLGMIMGIRTMPPLENW